MSAKSRIEAEIKNLKDDIEEREDEHYFPGWQRAKIHGLEIALEIVKQQESDDRLSKQIEDERRAADRKAEQQARDHMTAEEKYYEHDHP